MPKSITVAPLTFTLVEEYLVGAVPTSAHLAVVVYKDGRAIDMVIPLSSAEMRSIYEQLQQIVLAALEAEQAAP